MTVVCLVANSISKDTRVIKVANAVKESGRDICVVGLQDNSQTCASEISNTGIKYFRLPWRSSAYQHIANLTRWFGLAVLVLCIAIYELNLINERVLIYLIFMPLALWLILRVSNKFTAIAKKYEQSTENSLTKEKERLKSKASLNGSLSKKGLNLNRIVAIFSNAKAVLMQVLIARYRDRAFVDFVVKLNPCIVHCHDITTLHAGVIIKKKTGAKLIYDAHEYYEGSAGLSPTRKNLFKLIHLKCCYFVDTFFVVNKSIACLYKKEYKKFVDPIVIMNAVNIPPFSEYDGRLHKAAGVSSDKKIILFQGGYSKFRGLDKLIDCACYFPDDWVLVLMGWGMLESSLREQVESYSRELGREIAVRFIPAAPQEDLMLWTQGAEVGVILYENNGINHKYCTPNKLWEFPAAGVPIIVSPRVEMEAIVNKYEHGVVIKEPFDHVELNKVIYTIIENKEVYKKNCLKFMKENSWDLYKNTIQHEYNLLCH